MSTVKFSSMTTPQLVAFYNRHSTKPVKRFSDRQTAEKRCAELFASLKTNDTTKVMNQKSDLGNARPVMRASLKLDRTIRCVDTKQTWKNAYQMWRENPEWMTSSQQDRLTAQLYAAAKDGQRLRVKINDRAFELVHVAKVEK